MATSRMRRYCTRASMAGVIHSCRYAGGIAASGGTGTVFIGNLFTRDTCRVLLDVMNIPGYGPFIREMLGTLPQWQGVKEDPATNEFPGSLQHQVFRQLVGGRKLPNKLVEQSEYWTSKWGVPMTWDKTNGKQFVIYNSSDGPLLYIIALARYVKRYGYGVLDDEFRHWPTRRRRTVRQAAMICIEYIIDRIRAGEEAGHGLYGVPNTNPLQTSPSGVMRDGFDAYVRSDGTPADYSSMVYVENQALAHMALGLAAVTLFRDHPQADLWIDLAGQLQQRTHDELWMEDCQFFAAGRDKHGVVDMPSSAVFELLDGPFLAAANGPDMIRTLVKRLYGADFMTPIGARMTSLDHADLEGGYYAYQGSGAVWGVTNGIIQRGLSGWKLPLLANDLGRRRMVEGFSRSRSAVEMTYVDRRRNQPLYIPEEVTAHNMVNAHTIYPAEVGQNDQAWSASAALRILSSTPPRPDRHSWQDALQQEMLERVMTITTARDASFPGPIYVNTKTGQQLKEDRAKRLGAAA